MTFFIIAIGQKPLQEKPRQKTFANLPVTNCTFLVRWDLVPDNEFI